MTSGSGQSVALGSALDARISGSFRNRYQQELFRNSGQFPIANLLLELLLEGPAIFLAPDIYTLIGATLLQAWVLTRSAATAAPRRFLGNLVGPAAYSAVEAGFEGWEFFASPNHLAYWVFAAAIGALQAARTRLGSGKINEIDVRCNDQDVVNTLIFDNTANMFLDVIDCTEIDRHVDTDNLQLRTLLDRLALDIDERAFLLD